MIFVKFPGISLEFHFLMTTLGKNPFGMASITIPRKHIRAIERDGH